MTMPGATVSAHASLLSSTPAANSVLERGPAEIVLRFDEEVEASLSSIELFDADGARVEVGAVVSGEPIAGTGTSDDASVISVEVPAGDSSAAGLYAVRWTVTSLDGHVIDGAFAFQVGTASTGAAADLLASISADRGSRAVDVSYSIARFVSLLGLALLVGGGVWAVQYGGALLQWRRPRLVLGAGAVLLVLGSAAALMLFSMQVGRGVGATLEVTTGRMLALRSGAAVVLAALALVGGRGGDTVRRQEWWRLAVVLATGAVLVGFSAAGHASALDPAWLWVGLDVVHLLGATLWLGGLLLVVPLPGSALATPDTELVVRRYSTVATVAVPLVVLTGVVQAVRLAGSTDDVTSTAWGRLLLVKVTIVVGVLGLAGAARWMLAREGVSSIRRTMVVEAVAGLVVIGLVAALVGQAPREAPASRPFGATLTVDGAIASVTVSPGVVGINEIHIVVTPPGGSLAPVADVQARVTLAGSGEPASPVSLTREGPDHFSGTVAFTSSGDWTLELVVSLDDASSSLVRTLVTIP